MKKIIIILALLVIGLVLLPIVGNRVAEDSLNDRVEVLVSYGLEVSNSDTKSTYLRTKKYYEFSVKDANKFVEYLNQFSDEQLPPYVNAILEGAVVATDIEYNNFPLSEAIKVDIYPLSLSTQMIEELQKDNIDFYNYLSKLLQSKGILYHINYNIVSSDFDGYIKDIDEKYSFDDGVEISLKLKDALYKGSGPLVAPESLNSSIGVISVNVKKPKEELVLNLKDFSSSATFESQSTYVTGAKVKNIEFIFDARERAKITANDIHLNLSSNTQGKKAEFYAKTSFKDLTLVSKTKQIKASNFNYDISLSDIDKDSYEEFRLLAAKAKVGQSSKLQNQIEQNIMKVLSKGFTLSIADFSLARIALNNTKSLNGFNLKAEMNLKEDISLSNNLNFNPLQLAKNLKLDMNFKLSKALFAVIAKEVPMSVFASAYAKEVGDDLVFDLIFDNGSISLNGKSLR